MSLLPDGSESEELAVRARAKSALIEVILQEKDLYKVLGARRDCSAVELRRCYLERSKICHPDKLPFNPKSTSAFQRLGFAFEILKSPSSRRAYDRAPGESTIAHQPAEPANFLGGDQTFCRAVEAILNEFITGDFATVRRGLESLHGQYPNLVSEEVAINVERGFLKMRELVLTTKTYGLLIYIELGRIHRVQKRLMDLGYLDVVGRIRLTVHLVQVTLAVPMRVDRALKQKEEQEWRARTAGLQATGLPQPEASRRAGILNDRVSKVLKFIVGEAGNDAEADEAWNARMRGMPTSNPTCFPQ